MDLEGIMLSKISQSEKDKYLKFQFTWNLKHKANKHNTTETDSQKTNFWFPEWRGVGG